MISAFAHAGAVLDEPRYTRSRAAARPISCSRRFMPEGELLRRFRDGDAAIPGSWTITLFTQALLDLYSKRRFDPPILTTGHPTGGAADRNCSKTARMAAFFSTRAGDGEAWCCA